MAQIGDVVVANTEGFGYHKNAVATVLKICGDWGKMIVKFSSGDKMDNVPQIVTIDNFRVIPKG